MQRTISGHVKRTSTEPLNKMKYYLGGAKDLQKSICWVSTRKGTHCKTEFMLDELVCHTAGAIRAASHDRPRYRTVVPCWSPEMLSTLPETRLGLCRWLQMAADGCIWQGCRSDIVGSRYIFEPLVVGVIRVRSSNLLGDY